MPLLDEVRARLRTARRVTIMTGAGVSAASGVPTFRGPGGLWRKYRPADLATPEAFERNPGLVWEWYQWRRGLIAACSPNPAHEVIADWTRRDGVTLVTQNVDGLHERAGALDVIRYHGSVWRLRCTRCGEEWEDLRVPLPELPPHCAACSALARPAVVWFGEPIDPTIAARAETAARECDVFLSVGTSSVVYPAAALVHVARSHSAYTVEINPEATDASGLVNMAIAMPAEHALPAIGQFRGW